MSCKFEKNRKCLTPFVKDLQPIIFSRFLFSYYLLCQILLPDKLSFLEQLISNYHQLIITLFLTEKENIADKRNKMKSD